MVDKKKIRIKKDEIKKKHRNINQSKVVQIHLLGIELLRIGFGNLSVWKKERKTKKKRQNTNNNNLIIFGFSFGFSFQPKINCDYFFL